MNTKMEVYHETINITYSISRVVTNVAGLTVYALPGGFAGPLSQLLRIFHAGRVSCERGTIYITIQTSVTKAIHSFLYLTVVLSHLTDLPPPQEWLSYVAGGTQGL